MCAAIKIQAAVRSRFLTDLPLSRSCGIDSQSGLRAVRLIGRDGPINHRSYQILKGAHYSFVSTQTVHRAHGSATRNICFLLKYSRCSCLFLLTPSKHSTNHAHLRAEDLDFVDQVSHESRGLRSSIQQSLAAVIINRRPNSPSR